MKKKQDSPGVYIPPPFFYGILFLAGIQLQKRISIDRTFFHSTAAKLTGIIFMLTAVSVTFTGIAKFIQSRNTLILIKPAKSLQTKGIYSITRNPMYLGLVFIYLGLTFLAGNWWHMILLPFLILIMQLYVIKKEEEYLERAFGKEYLDYKQRVRRWI